MSASKPAVSSLKRTQTQTQIEYDEQDAWLDMPESKEEETASPLKNREVWMLCEDDEILDQVEDYLTRNKIPETYTGPIFVDDNIFILDVPMQ